MKLTIDFNNNIATTTKSIQADANKMYSLLYQGAFSNNVTFIQIIKSGFITSKIIKACKVCLARGIEVQINEDYLRTWDSLNPYTQAISDFIEDMNNKEDISKICSILCNCGKELIDEYSKGLDEFHEYLDGYIYNSGYDVSLSSEFTYDKKSCGSYEDSTGKKQTYSYNYTPKGTSYRTSLLDKLYMYQNIKFYKDNGFEPDRFEDKEKDIVVPVSACAEYTQMLFE